MPHCFRRFFVPTEFRSHDFTLCSLKWARKLWVLLYFFINLLKPPPQALRLLFSSPALFLYFNQIRFLFNYSYHLSLLLSCRPKPFRQKKHLLYTLHRFLIKFISWHLTYRAGRNHKCPACKHPNAGNGQGGKMSWGPTLLNMEIRYVP